MRSYRVMIASSLLLGCAAVAQQSALERIQWIKFEDRNELALTNQKAFTMDVPRGWLVDGGMARLSALQVSPYVRMLAPDGGSYLVIGNPDTPSYVAPNKSHPRPGESYRPNGTGQVDEVEAYTAGSRYAQQIGPKLLGEACSGLTFASAKDRPDIREQQIKLFGGQIPDANMGDHSAREDAGEAVWTCQHGNKPAEAHLVVVTHKGSAMCTFVDCITSWGVDGMFGYIVPAGKAAGAEQAIQHMIASIAYNPAWLQVQRNLTAAEVAKMNQNWQQMQQTIAHIQRRQAAFQQNFQAMDDTISGYHEYHDSEGTPYLLDNTKNQWKCASKIVGTTNALSPGVGCSMLSR
ncbi:MAG TPA: hypothetical protein VGG72_15385 [Bryobacteraceae bacterium]|jgi:hypothetical protein